MEPFYWLPRRRRRADLRRVARRQLLVARRNVPGDDRVLRVERTLLAIALYLPDRNGGGGRHGSDQRRRKYRRFYGAFPGRLDQGRDRKFRQRPLRACR